MLKGVFTTTQGNIKFLPPLWEGLLHEHFPHTNRAKTPYTSLYYRRTRQNMPPLSYQVKKHQHPRGQKRSPLFLRPFFLRKCGLLVCSQVLVRPDLYAAASTCCSFNSQVSLRARAGRRLAHSFFGGNELRWVVSDEGGGVEWSALRLLMRKKKTIMLWFDF